MKVLTSLNLANLKQNRARTIMTIVGVALSVALILTVIGFATSFIKTEREAEAQLYGDYHVMYRDVPGKYVSAIENSPFADVQYYSEHVECDPNDDEYYYCKNWAGYYRSQYEPITDAASLERNEEHVYNVFIKYADIRKSEHSRKMIMRAIEDAGYTGDEILVHENMTVATIDGDMPETERIVLSAFASLVIGAMAIAAAFVIRNSFNISITERVRQFGMLASVGARPRQIRRMVYQEGLLVGLIAIPLGILLGSGATFILTLIVNHLFADVITIDMLFYIPFSVYLITVGVGLFIILLAAASPAIVASRVSPIAALRNVQDIKVKPRKVCTLKLTQKIWGIGGAIAAKNLKRNRQKYRTTVVSIVLSVSVFIGVSSFMMYGHRIIDLFIQDTGANLIISSDSKELFADIINKFHPQHYAYYYSGAIWTEDNTRSVPTLLVASRDEFARYARENGYYFGDYSQMAFLQDHYSMRDYNGNTTYQRGTKYKAGDEITYRLGRSYYEVIEDEELESVDIEGMSDEELETYRDSIADEHARRKYDDSLSDPQTIKITAVVEGAPLGWTSETFTPSGILFISEDHPVAKELEDYLYGESLNIADAGLGENIKKYLEDMDKQRSEAGEPRLNYYAEDIEESAKNVRSLILLFEILSYGFILVVSLIGVTNIFNTITTNIALRAKEFAMLKSVGMTDKEFNHMIRLESAMYTTRALLIGLPIGFLLSYGVSRLFSEARLGFGWLIPWSSVAICIFAVAILIAVIMRYSVRKIKKQNIIETIRKESF